MKSNVMDEVKRLFKPEFLNRIDEVIVFHALNREHVRSIVSIMLDSLAKRIRTQMNIGLEVDETARDYIAKTGYDEKYGARPLRRAIQSKVEDALAEKILDGQIKAGDSVRVTEKEEELVFEVNAV